MTTTTTTTTGYAEAVRQALDDLPPATVTDLVEGLDEHLAEVGATNLVTLVALLGPPERYAADLRASAGLPPRPAVPPSISLPPPIPPPARHPFTIRRRHLARVALAVIVLATLLSLAATKDTVDPLVVVAIVLAVGVGAWLLHRLARAADIPGAWANGALVVLVALTLAVAAAAGAAHPRNEFTPYPYFQATTVFGSPMPDLTNRPVQDAIAVLQEMGLVAVIVGQERGSTVVVSQEPAPGSYVSPGTQVRLTTGQPGGSETTTFPTIPFTPTTSH
ncbi:MAG: hypothetical protein QOD72_1802 [Acidimicrobiaceae bacterium]|jgi:hypothetical protein|nr:hypothetical protein [Acidimicrobiaceae bacterium]